MEGTEGIQSGDESPHSKEFCDSLQRNPRRNHTTSQQRPDGLRRAQQMSRRPEAIVLRGWRWCRVARRDTISLSDSVSLGGNARKSAAAPFALSPYVPSGSAIQVRPEWH